MKQLFKALALAILPLFASAQQKVFDYTPGIKNGVYGIADSYIISNPADSSMAVFMIESGNVHGIFTDKNDSIKAEILFDQKEKNYDAYIGYSIEGQLIHLAFSGKKAKEIYTVTFDPANKKAYGTWVPVLKMQNEDDEVFISSVNHNGSLYLLYINKKTSGFKTYHLISPARLMAQNFGHGKTNLYERYFKKYLSLELNAFGLPVNRDIRTLATTITDDYFYDISATQAKNKLYSFKSNIILTLDDDEILTTLIEINPDENTCNIKNFNHVDGSLMDLFFTKSGSFYFRNFLLQTRISNNHMVFTIRNVATDSLIKCLEVFEKDQAIPFINLPVTEESNGIVKKTKFSPDKFLAKVSKLNPALSAFQFGDTIQIFFGGYIKASSSGPMMMGANGMTTGGFAGPPTEKVIYTIGLFDSDTFSHLEGAADRNIFSKMPELNKGKKEAISGESMIQAGSHYYYGFYNNTKQKYSLYRFE